MAKALRSRAWVNTSLGPVKRWPSSLKTILGIVLNAPNPMFCIWGRDRRCFYNDALAAQFSAHSPSLPVGESLLRPLPEQWDSILASVEQVFATGQPLPPACDCSPATNGKAAANHELWTYSPIWDEAGQVGGVFGSSSSIGDSGWPEQAEMPPSAPLPPPFSGPQLQVLANSLPVLLAYVDHERRYQFVNQTYTDWFGIPPEEIIGKHVEAVIGATAYQAIKPDIDAVLSGQELSSERSVCFNRIGWRHVQRYFVPDIAATGDVKGYYALISDVTEHRRTEHSLQQREEELYLITDALPALVAFVDQDQRYRFNNQTYQTWFGIAPQSLRHQSVRTVVGDAAYAVIRPYIEQALAGQTVSFEHEIPFQVGGTRHVEATYVPRWDDQGTVSGFVALVRDVSDRKRAEAALKESENRFQLVADASPIMIWMSAPDGAGVWFNQPWYEFTGQTPAEALGQGWVTALHPEDARTIHQSCMQAHQNREPVRLEYRLRQQDGTYRWVMDSAMPRFDQTGTYLGYIGSIIDIHDRKQAEAERERLLLELAAERARFEAVLGQMPEGVMIAEAASDSLILANEQTHQILRYRYDLGAALPTYQPLEPFLAQRPTGEAYTADEYPLARSLHTGEIINHEEMILHFPDGSQAVIDVNSAPIINSQGHITAAVAVFQDVTDRQRAEVALRQSAEQARLAIQVGRLGTWRYDLEQDHVELDQRMRQIWGEPADTTPTLAQLLTRIHPDDRQRIGNAVEVALAPHSDGVYEADYRVVWDDGTIRWVSANGQARFAGAGTARHAVDFYGTVLDITGRKQAEAALQAQEQRYRYIFEAVNVAIWEEDFTQVKAALDQLKAAGVTDFYRYFTDHPEFVQTAIDQVQVRDVNEAALRMFHALDKADLLGSLHAIFVPETHAIFVEQLLAIAAGDVFFEAETVVQTRQGDRLQVLVNIAFPRNGTYDRVLVSLLDLTERKRADIALREAEERLRIALENAPITVFNQDRDLRYTWIYKPALHQPSKVLGRHDREFLDPDDAAAITAIKQQVLNEGQRLRQEVKVTHGELDYYFDLTVEPLRDAAGTIIGITGSTIDISAPRRTATELQESEERLRLAMEGAQMATWDVDLVTGRAIWSDRHFAMLGYEPTSNGEASEAMWNDRLHPDDRDRVFGEWQQARREHRFYRAEYRIIRADNGEVCWLEGLGNFKYDASGQAIRSLGVLFDINERKQGEVERQQAEMALREQRTLLETILRQAADAILVCDAEANLAFVNREARRLAQLDPNDTTLDINLLAWGIAYDTAGEVIPLEHYSLSRALRGEATNALECRMVRQDGSYYDILISAAPLWNEHQQIIGAVATFVDISDRKRAEEVLRESEARFRHLADSAPMLVWMSGPDKRCHYFNQSWLDFTGRSLAQELGDGWTEGVDPADLDHCIRTYTTAFDARQEFEMEYRLRRADGEYRWILDVGVPRSTADGEFLGYIGCCFDIHDRKQAEAALQESEERFRNLADNISQFAWMTDPSGWIFWYNQRWFDYTGTTLEEMAGWGWQAVHHPDHVDRVVGHFRRSIETGEPWEDTFPLRGHDGQYRWFLSRALPIRDQAGNVLRWFGTNTDITERKQAEEALAQREAELSLVTNAAPALIAFIDAEQRYRFNNHRYEDWFGLSAEALYGISLQEAFDAAGYAEIQPYVERVLAGEEVTYERQVRHKDGSIRDASVTYVPKHNAAGQVEGFVAMISDITDRRRAEAARRESEDRLRIAIESAKLGTWDWNLVTNELLWDAGCKAMFGLAPEAETSMETFLSALHADDRDRLIQVIQESLTPANGGDYDAEFRAIGVTDGVERWILAKGQAYFDRRGKPQRFIGTVLDITDQKRFEQTLMDSEEIARAHAEELTAIMETTPAAIWLSHDRHCHQMTANQTAYELMGMEPHPEIMPTATPADGSNPLPFRQRRNGQDISPQDLPMQKAARLGQEVTEEMEFVFEDGTVRYVYGKAVPLFGPDGAVRGAIGGFVDITALKHSEQERERLLQRERLAREAAEKASRIKDEFLAILSHELRSPLNPILGWATLLRRGRMDAEKTAIALETIERNAKLQIQLIDDLLDISRIIRGKLTLNMAPVSLETTIDAAIETVRLAAEAKSIQIHTQVDAPVSEVLGDSARLQQIVWNLLSNAVKFTPEGGRVDIHLSAVVSQPSPAAEATLQTPSPSPTGQYAQIRVSDTGKGIHADFLPHVFEHFRQADSTTTRNFGGLGLGLAIVRYLVELHGGTVLAASPGEGQGATFTVRLPLPKNQIPALPSEAPPIALIAETAPLHGQQILLVDDDADSRHLIAVALAEQGAQITDVGSAPEALKAFEQTRFDLLISDIGMPEMDGYALIQQLRLHPPDRGGNVLAIALTAYAGEKNQQQAIAAGFQQHVPKPVELDKFIALVVSLLRDRP